MQLDLARWKDATRDALTHWFNTFQTQTKDIPLGNIYNMDESGFSIGTEECSRVIIDQSTLQTRYKTYPGRQEWVSVVECICADGSIVPPLFLFKAEGVNANLVTEELLADWYISGTSQGWTSNAHGLEWLVKCFEPSTREKAAG